MEKINLLEFLEYLKEWEANRTLDDHGCFILGSRDRKPEFQDIEVSNERD